MAKKIKTVIKLQAPAGKATPGQQIGTALGPHGVNMMDFITQFNEQTRTMGDTIVPVEISIFDDRSFSFITKTPPASFLIRKALGIEKGSGVPNKEKVGKLTRAQLKQIAETKMPDLNANDIDAAMRIVAGTARSMGVTIEE